MKPARLRPQAKRDRLAEIRHYRDVAGTRVAETLLLATDHALDLLGERQDVLAILDNEGPLSSHEPAAPYRT